MFIIAMKFGAYGSLQYDMTIDQLSTKFSEMLVEAFQAWKFEQLQFPFDLACTLFVTTEDVYLSQTSCYI